MAEKLSDPWMAGAALAVACALCITALRFVPELPPMPRSGHYGRVLIDVLEDLRNVAKSRAGFLALLICLVPIGSGAASNLWASVATPARSD